jgi:hypothetical protein
MLHRVQKNQQQVPKNQQQVQKHLTQTIYEHKEIKNVQILEQDMQTQ